MQHEHAAGLLATLRRFQRRLALSKFIRVGAVTCSCALAGADVALLGWRPAPITAVLVVIVALLFGLAVALLIARIRMPSLIATAMAVDRRLRLENRAVTALEFSAADDPVARLIVAEASARLEAIPTKSIPLEITPFRWLAAAMVLVSVFVAANSRERSLWPFRSAAAVRTSSNAAGAQSSRAPGQSAARQPVAPGQESAAPTANGVHQATRSQKVSGAGEPAGPTRDSVPNHPPAPASAVERAGDAARGESAMAPRAAGSMARARAGGDANPGSGGAAQGASTGSAAGRGGRDNVSPDSMGGGVNHGEIVARAAARAGELPVPANRDVSSLAYRQAFERAESAIANGSVPPGLREYVRNYFLAIRPQPAP